MAIFAPASIVALSALSIKTRLRTIRASSVAIAIAVELENTALSLRTARMPERSTWADRASTVLAPELVITTRSAVTCSAPARSIATVVAATSPASARKISVATVGWFSGPALTMTSDTTDSAAAEASPVGRTALSAGSALSCVSVPVSSRATSATLPELTGAVPARDQAGECSIGSPPAWRSGGSDVAADGHHAHQHDRETENGDQEQERRGGGATHIERGECVLPDRIGDRLRGAPRPATREDVDQVIRFHGGDHADQH